MRRGCTPRAVHPTSHPTRAVHARSSRTSCSTGRAYGRARLRLCCGVVDPSGVADTYTRGATGIIVSPRRVAWVGTAAGVSVLAFLVVLLIVSAVGELSRASSLRHVGVPVLATVTGCVGRASGTGITTVGYTCRAAFTLAGHRHEAVIGGSSALLAPGEIVRAVADPNDPSVLAAARSVAGSTSSWTVFIAPAALLLMLGGVVAVAARRLRPTTPAVGVFTRRKSRGRSGETRRS